MLGQTSMYETFLLATRKQDQPCPPSPHPPPTLKQCYYLPRPYLESIRKRAIKITIFCTDFLQALDILNPEAQKAHR